MNQLFKIIEDERALRKKLKTVFKVAHRVTGELILDAFDKGTRFPKLDEKTKRKLDAELRTNKNILVGLDIKVFPDEGKLRSLKAEVGFKRVNEIEKEVKKICKKLGLNYNQLYQEAEKEMK